MLHSGNAHVGIAATTSTTKGGEDITNSQSELDSLSDTDNESQGSESDTDSEEHHSEDHHSDEDVTSTSTTDSEMEYDEAPCSATSSTVIFLTRKFRPEFQNSG